jgi:hypothetical protein
MDQYGVDNILGLTVGNEYLLDSNADATTLSTATTYLLAKIADTRSVLASKHYNRTIPVGSGDAGSMITAQYAAACDYVRTPTPVFSMDIVLTISTGDGELTPILRRGNS